MHIKIDIDTDAILEIQDWPRKIDRALGKAAIDVMGLFEKHAKKTFGRREGGLKSIHGTLKNRIKGVSGKKTGKRYAGIANNLIYARLHEKGGTITPRKGVYLKFKATQGKYEGKDIFIKQAIIPKRPFMEPAVMESLGKAETIIEDKIIKELEK